MTNSNLFELVKLINASKGDPSAMTYSIWEAGYRQPVRSAEEAAKITIELFFYCNSSLCLPISGRVITTAFSRVS
ncbi:Uncharacterised protein [Enterobacter hormaechei]|nr:Uncharacterised protein [Enterobacter hormaechei]